MSAADRWIPDADVVAGPVGRYDDAPPWTGASGCSGGPSPGTRALGEYIRGRWGVSTGGYNCRQNTANAAETSVHGTGRALDITIPPAENGPGGLGDEIASVLGANAAALGVQLIVWRRTLVNYSRPATDRHRLYTGPDAHVSHIHLELNNAGGRAETPWFAAGRPALERAGGGAWGWWVALAGAVGVGVAVGYRERTRRRLRK